MNIHPLVVHFPIALLFTYGVFELLRFKKLTSQSYWFYIKAILVILGTVAAYVAAFFGDIAKHAYGDRSNPVLQLHPLFAEITIVIFSIIAAAYLIRWIGEADLGKIKTNKIWLLLVWLSDLVLSDALVIILVILGLVSLATTGALGGILVYGQNNDPFAAFVYKLLVR